MSQSVNPHEAKKRLREVVVLEAAAGVQELPLNHRNRHIKTEFSSTTDTESSAGPGEFMARSAGHSVRLQHYCVPN